MTTRSRWLGTMTGLLLSGLLSAACGVESQSAPEPVPVDRLPSAAADPGSTGQASLRERVWGVRGDLLVPVFVGLTGMDAESRLRSLLALAGAGGQAPSLLASQTRLVAFRQEDDLLEIELSSELQRVPARRRPLVLGQIVLTVTEDPGARRVRVRSGGVEMRLTDPAGTPINRPLQRGDFDGLVTQNAEN